MSRFLPKYNAENITFASNLILSTQRFLRNITLRTSYIARYASSKNHGENITFLPNFILMFSPY
eukprot:UN13753